ncbi:hypothetical protein G9Q84_21600 [Pseudomonas sp. P7]|uniref:hypothetical protein n=1 Tax=Pseudomonas sivasensis TaxID=1880678 RepID=UPI0015EC9A4D|nr:hypothetical protein [Pseudomonas sivasensis]
MQLLEQQLATVAKLAMDNKLPDAILTESGLKITPLDAAVPDTAQALIDKTSPNRCEHARDRDEERGITHFAKQLPPRCRIDFTDNVPTKPSQIIFSPRCLDC